MRPSPEDIERGRIETTSLSRSQADQHGDIVGVEPPQGRTQAMPPTRRRATGHRRSPAGAAFSSLGREEANVAAPIANLVPLGRRAHCQRPLERPPLAIGELEIDARNGRHTSNSVPNGMRRLGLDAGDDDHLHAVGAAHRVLQKRGLPYSRLACDDKDAATSASSVREHPLQDRARSASRPISTASL